MNDALAKILAITEQLGALRTPGATAIGQLTGLSFQQEVMSTNTYYQYYQAAGPSAPFAGGELRIPQIDNPNKPTILILHMQEGQHVTARQIQQRMGVYPTAIPPSPTGPADTYQHVYQYKSVELSFCLSSGTDELKQVMLSSILNK